MFGVRRGRSEIFSPRSSSTFASSLICILIWKVYTFKYINTEILTLYNQGRNYRQCHRCVAPGPPSPNNFQGPPTDIHQTFFSYHKITLSWISDFVLKQIVCKYNTCRLQQIEPDRSHITIIKRFIWKIIKANLKIAFAWSGAPSKMLHRGPEESSYGPVYNMHSLFIDFIPISCSITHSSSLTRACICLINMNNQTFSCRHWKIM